MVSMAKATPKIIYYRDETAQKLIAGINTVANVVKVKPTHPPTHPPTPPPTPTAPHSNRLVLLYLPIHPSTHPPSFPIKKKQTTLGPRGRNVVLMRDVGYPEVINDGVTIARYLRVPPTHPPTHP